MKRLFQIAACLSLCVCAGCASGSKKKPARQAAAVKPQHRLVGTIVAVNEAQRFVLIDTEASYPAAVGMALKSFSNGEETGVLTVSPEVKTPFMIADIVSGTPRKGDQVFE